MAIDTAALASSLAALREQASASDAPNRVRRAIAAAKVLFDADAAGLMLLGEEDALQWVGASDEFGQAAEGAQLQLSEGPCLLAFTTGTLVAVSDLAADPRFGAVTLALGGGHGIRAALSAPLNLDGSPIGTLDLYWFQPHAFDDSQTAAASMYGELVGGLLTMTVAAQASGRLAEQLRVALERRVLIEQAKGVLMARERIDDVTAFEHLRTTARNSQRRVVEIARKIVADAAHRNQP